MSGGIQIGTDVLEDAGVGRLNLDEDWIILDSNRTAKELVNDALHETPNAGVLEGKDFWETVPDKYESYRSRAEDGIDISFEASDLSFSVHPRESGFDVFMSDASETDIRTPDEDNETQISDKELEMYRTVVQAVDDPIYATDSEGNFSFVNEAFEEMTGYESEEVVGEHVSIIKDDETVKKAEKVLRGMLSSSDTDITGTFEFDVETADGKQVPSQDHMALLPLEDGEFQGTAGVIRDITERKRHEQELELLKQVLSRFLRHNIRNEVNVILGYAQLLSEKGEGEMADKIIDKSTKIIDETEKTRLVEQILDRENDGTEVDVNKAVEKAVREVSNEYSESEIVFETEIEDGTKVFADDALEDAVRNLVENGVEHNDSETPRVNISVSESEGNGGSIEVRVEDNGPGIPREEVEALDEIEENPLKHGSGIGLYLVNWIADRSAAELRFPQNQNRGEVVLELERIG